MQLSSYKLVSVLRDMAVNIPGYSNHDKVAHAYAYGGTKTANCQNV
ncbi:LCP family protein [Mammaliicoccus sciuri]